MRQNKPKRKVLPKVSLGSIEIENLPLPVVYYPGHYGTFFCFSHEKYDYASLAMCSCFKKSIINYFRLIKLDKSNQSYRNELKQKFPGVIVNRFKNWDKEFPIPVKFGDGICHKCNNVTPSIRYCHEIYGTKFIQYYGWYVNQTYLQLGILFNFVPSIISFLPDVCPKEFQDDINEINILRDMLPNNIQALKNYLSENIIFEINNSKTSFWRNLRREYPDYINDVESVVRKKERVFSNKVENITRAEMGFKYVGDGWINETVLLHIIKNVFPNEDVIFHSKPDWLNGLEIDIFVPKHNIGFEYQGEQHYHSIEAWGGQEALEELQERDIRKKSLCKENGVHLITIDYSETLTEKFIRDLINFRWE